MRRLIIIIIIIIVIIIASPGTFTQELRWQYWCICCYWNRFVTLRIDDKIAKSSYITLAIAIFIIKRAGLKFFSRWHCTFVLTDIIIIQIQRCSWHWRFCFVLDNWTLMFSQLAVGYVPCRPVWRSIIVLWKRTQVRFYSRPLTAWVSGMIDVLPTENWNYCIRSISQSINQSINNNTSCVVEWWITDAEGHAISHAMIDGNRRLQKAVSEEG